MSRPPNVDTSPEADMELEAPYRCTVCKDFGAVPDGDGGGEPCPACDGRNRRGAYDGEHAYLVILTQDPKKGRRQPGALPAFAYTVVKAPTESVAIERAFPKGSPVLSVKRVNGAIAFRLHEPRAQIFRALLVEQPEWGQPQGLGGR